MAKLLVEVHFLEISPAPAPMNSMLVHVVNMI